MANLDLDDSLRRQVGESEEDWINRCLVAILEWNRIYDKLEAAGAVGKWTEDWPPRIAIQ